eukprot:4345173-Pyramimonas_sp.AAC.1
MRKEEEDRGRGRRKIRMSQSLTPGPGLDSSHISWKTFAPACWASSRSELRPRARESFLRQAAEGSGG